MINERPSSASAYVFVTPTVGIAYETNFKIQCGGFYDYENGGSFKLYKFGYRSDYNKAYIWFHKGGEYFLFFVRRLFMVFYATFNNISVLSWLSVLLVEETGENHRPVAINKQTWSHNVVSSTPRHERGSNSQL